MSGVNKKGGETERRRAREKGRRERGEKIGRRGKKETKLPASVTRKILAPPAETRMVLFATITQNG